MSNRSGRTPEQQVNEKIAELLKKRYKWTAMAERSGRIVGRSGMKPDIIVEVHGMAVIVETEYPPNSGLDGDVERVIDKKIVGLGAPSAIIGMVIPVELKQYDGAKLRSEISKRTDLKYYIRYVGGNRFPESGYLMGGIQDLAAAISLTSVPWDKINKCVEIMKESVKKMTHNIELADSGVKKNICARMRQNPSTQTWDMASLIVLNAGVFYQELAAVLAKIKPLSTLAILGKLSQSAVISAWYEVLDINYVPIFQDAVEILASFPGNIASEILDIMYETVSKISALKVTKSGDVYGALYQDMLQDRERIAAYYTRPEAAALLASLVMPTSDDSIWQDKNKVKNIRVADFACGTGMLLTHAYYHIRHNAHHDMSDLHKHMMENSFYGYDILPTATHLTLANLAGLASDVKFELSNIFTLPIGEKKSSGSERGYDLGSLDLISQQEKFTEVGIRHGGTRSTSSRRVSVNDGSCDFILMNPPYVRTTNHNKKHTDPVPPFAVFGIPGKMQGFMADHLNKMYAKTDANGNAGFASHFFVICDRKLRGGDTRTDIARKRADRGCMEKDQKACRKILREHNAGNGRIQKRIIFVQH